MKTKIADLQDVAETLLISLYYRAQESQRPDAIIRDPAAVALVTQIDHDWSRFAKLAGEQTTAMIRTRVFDSCARAFLDAQPDGIVVNIGCGLDTRFQRVDNGRAAWYDLDLPPVIALRARLLGDTPRTQMIGCSAFEFEWMDRVAADGPAYLFSAEGVFPYFPEAEIKPLILELKRRFPGAELIFDALSPFITAVHNLELARTKLPVRLRWGLREPRALERWEPGIRLLDRWYYFDQPEASRRGLGWLRFIPLLNHCSSILHYRLGRA